MTDRKKKRGKLEGFAGKICVFCLFVVMILNVVIPDKEYSESEDRKLASVPAVSPESILSGTFTEKLNTYLTDQFAGRELLRKFRFFAERIGGNREENGVYIGKSGQLLADIEVPVDTQLIDKMSRIKEFAADYPDIPVTMMLVPDAATVLHESLPAFASVEDQSQIFGMVRRELGDSVTWVDALSVLNKYKNEKIYYKTDEHWTTLGAFYAFQEAAPLLGIDKDVTGAYVSFAVSGNFNGSLASRSGAQLNEKEEIDIYVPLESDSDVVVEYVEEGKRTTSLYDSAALDEKNQYEVFLGGDHAVVDIRTVSSAEKRLLVVKDSFANCFIPFLTPYYREIVVVDPELYAGSMKELMETWRITDVLFLYSGNGFVTDNDLSGVISGE